MITEPVIIKRQGQHVYYSCKLSVYGEHPSHLKVVLNFTDWKCLENHFIKISKVLSDLLGAL